MGIGKYFDSLYLCPFFIPMFKYSDLQKIPT